MQLTKSQVNQGDSLYDVRERAGRKKRGRRDFHRMAFSELAKTNKSVRAPGKDSNLSNGGDATLLYLTLAIWSISVVPILLILCI